MKYKVGQIVYFRPKVFWFLGEQVGIISAITNNGYLLVDEFQWFHTNTIIKYCTKLDPSLVTDYI